MPEAAVPDEAWSPNAAKPRVASSEVELPGYRDFELIAAGGESKVYRARQVGIDRLVAVKVLAAQPGGDHGSAARFRRELEITVRLGRAHPHIITVLDTLVLADGRPCIIMDFCDHGSLHDQLRARGPLPVNTVVAAGCVVADALSFAHGQGVLHRDVKPQNILVLPTSYVLADFGLARSADAGHTSSLERFSYRHAAPQVLDGELPTAADDVYSLGSTLFALLDGRPPFAADDADADTALAYLRRVRTEPPRRIRIMGVPENLVAIIDKCLAKRRVDRFPDAASLRDALAVLAVEDRAWAPGAIVTPLSFVEKPAAPAVPLALSAIEHLDERRPAAVVETDAIATGVRLQVPIDVPAAPPPARPRWPRLAVMAGIALLVGGLLGVGISWIRAVNTPHTLENTGRPVPSLGGALPTISGSPRVTDPAIAPEITRFEDRGTSFDLAWTDKSGGAAVFVVIEIAGAGGVPLVQVDAGQTSVIVERIDPSRSYCLAILAVTDTSQAISPLRCTGARVTPR